MNWLLPAQMAKIKPTMPFKQFCTKTKFTPHNPFLAKVIPRDIWAEEKDPRYTQTEVVEGRWHYVEKLFPKLRVPNPPKNVSSTGWKLPTEVPDLPYFIERTRNHMLPVYKTTVTKDQIIVTQIKQIKGDIWVFEQDLKHHLEEYTKEKIETQVNEMACFINVKGDHKSTIVNWLYDLGL